MLITTQKTHLIYNDFDNLAVLGAFFDNFGLQLFVYFSRTYHVLKYKQSMMSTVTLRLSEKGLA